MPFALIGLGANLGPREETLGRAVDGLAATARVRVAAVSRWHVTRPVGGPPGQPPFLNGAALLETALDPHALLARLKTIEQALGRTRAERWAPRTIDLDLLLYEELTLDGPDLAVPHPAMAWRRFVLEPAAEIASRMVHPTTGWTVARLLEHLNAARPYVAIAGPPGAGKGRFARVLAERTGAELLAEAGPGRLFKPDDISAGTAWETELQFLHARGALLAADHARWSAGRLVVSDFWLGQSLAYAKVRLPAVRREDFGREWAEVSRGAVFPKLTVLLDAPLEHLREHAARLADFRQARVDVSVERIREAVLEEASRPGVGPVLRLVAGGGSQALTETLAALEAMG